MALSGRQFTLSCGEYEATVVEVGAGLRRFVRGGVDVTCGYGEDVLAPKGCGGVLVPWPNRLRGGHYPFEGADLQLGLSEPANGNAIHGLGRWARWTPVRHEPSSVTLALDIVPQTGWPFEVSVEITYALDADGLTVTTTAHNRGVSRAPFGAGFHPYLSTHGAALEEMTVRLPAATRLLLDDRLIPCGREAVAGTPARRTTCAPGAGSIRCGWTTGSPIWSSTVDRVARAERPRCAHPVAVARDCGSTRRSATCRPSPSSSSPGPVGQGSRWSR